MKGSLHQDSSKVIHQFQKRLNNTNKDLEIIRAATFLLGHHNVQLIIKFLICYEQLKECCKLRRKCLLSFAPTFIPWICLVDFCMFFCLFSFFLFTVILTDVIYIFMYFLSVWLLKYLICSLIFFFNTSRLQKGQRIHLNQIEAYIIFISFIKNSISKKI